MDFPALTTGAVAQYPAIRETLSRTEVLQFIDGTEQRFPQMVRRLHRWTIQLDLLNEQELSALQNFFVAAKGRQGTFTFTDPWDGTRYLDCSFDSDVFDAEILGEMSGRTRVIIRENV